MNKYCSSQGLQCLRDEISKYLQKKRIAATPGQIVIANEVMQLMDFLLNIYIKPNDIIITEEPIFSHVYQLFKAFVDALLPLGFPLIILGGIYAGIFSPTESAAISCAYAFIVEFFIFHSITLRQLLKSLINIGVVTAECFILVGTGQILSWVLSYAAIPQTLASGVADMGLSATGFLVLVSVVFFIGCMFMDSIPLNYVLVPIFAPIGLSLGIDPIHLGLLVVVQTAIGCVTPPFGYNIFTAMAIFDLPYLTVIRKVWAYLAICIVGTVLLILFPDVTLFLRNIAFGT